MTVILIGKGYIIISVFILESAALDVTQQNRFLMIATSGGLNQQRTGVNFR